MPTSAQHGCLVVTHYPDIAGERATHSLSMTMTIVEKFFHLPRPANYTSTSGDPPFSNQLQLYDIAIITYSPLFDRLLRHTG